MPFPTRPPTDDERRAEFLRLALVPGHPRVYVLGSFARYATVHAQQVRALNLVDCLAKGGVVSARSRMAVVGGGIAGLTAAAAAAVRGVGRVVVFERDGDLLPLQRTSEQRYIHPHIYDWPASNALDDDAGLPILNWRAERAAEVVGHLSKAWHRLLEERPGIVEVRTSCGELQLEARAAPMIAMSDRSEAFDVVVLATGFGLDAGSGPGTDSYWTDSRIDGKEAGTEGPWLVSGGGDGALTDLMRLCIEGFRHKRVLEAVDEDVRRKVGAELVRAEGENLPPETLAQRYLTAAAAIAPTLEGRLKPRRIGKVWLNCSKEALFQPLSSRLNRLICAWLLHENRFEIVPEPGLIASLDPAPDEHVAVHFEDPATEPLVVRHAILRHGPRKDAVALARFPSVFAACADLRTEWRSVQQGEDWTNEPLYEQHDFAGLPDAKKPLRVDFGEKTGCVVVGRSKPLRGLSLVKRSQLALNRFKSEYAELSGLDLDPEPIELSVADVFASSASYERAVRALCSSPIAVVDITDYEPAVLLLLGIRAAARRGVTITVTEGPGFGGPLPFNLGTLNPVVLGGDSLQAIARALESGFRALRAQPNVYLDLPAYDALRKLGESHRTIEPEDQILFLCWFDEQYKTLARELVEARLRDAFKKAMILTTLDSRSPQLVEQRLYAAIRRTRLCVADWTGWRPNVFFEIGVRLAVNETDPIFILCADRPKDWNDDLGRWPIEAPKTADLLTRFFSPTRFNLDDDEALSARYDRFVTEHATREPAAKLSPGRTYAVVKESIDRTREAGGVPVHQVLIAEAKALIGELVVESGDSVPVLFADVLTEQARVAAVEHVLAAWFYLNGRYRLLEKRNGGTLSEDDRVLLGQLEEVWSALSRVLRQTSDPKYAKLRKELSDAMRGKS